VEFLSNVNVKPPAQLYNTPHKRKAPLLTTFWRRFCCNYWWNGRIHSCSRNLVV